LSSRRSAGAQNRQDLEEYQEDGSTLRSSVQDRIQTTLPVKELVEEEELLSARTTKSRNLTNAKADEEIHLTDDAEDEFDLEGSVYIDPSLMDSDKLSLSVTSANRILERASNRSNHESAETQVDLTLGKVFPLLIEGETAEILMGI
jgi:hypothetical protein